MGHEWMISLSWFIVLAWMIVIYKLSAQSGLQSNGLSMGVTGIIERTLAKITFQSELDLSRFNHMARKYAHFLTYLILGILVTNAVSRSGVLGGIVLVISLGICVLYAISDEVHQIFVPGRGASVKDVLIDSAGAAVGISVYSLVASI